MAYISKENTRDGIKPIGSNLYGTCASVASDTTKVVVMPDFDVLTEGITIHIYFQNSNTASNPLLKVGSTVAKSIVCNGVQNGSWEAGAFVSFTYYQNGWHQNDVHQGSSQVEADEVAFTDSTQSWQGFDNVTDVESALTAVGNELSAFGNDYVRNSQKGAANGVAPLDANSKINSQYLPTYVDVETDPTVPSWAKTPSKPTYTASEVGALPDDTEPSDLGVLDYIVAQGNENGWAYRVWKTNRMEMWGTFTDSTAPNISDAGGYRTSGVTPANFPIPFGWVPQVSVSIYANSLVLTPVCLTDPSITNVGTWAGYRVSSNGATRDKKFMFHCIGTKASS